MCMVSVSGCKVLVDGMQFGSTYSSHEAAINQGKKIHEKHYPTYKFEIIPEPIPSDDPKPLTKKRVTKWDLMLQAKQKADKLRLKVKGY